MIIKRQRQSFRLLSSSSSSSLILSEHRPLYHHHHWGCSSSSSSLLMAAAAAVAVAVAASYSSSLARGGNNHPNFTSSALNPNPNPNPNPIRVLPLNWRASLSMSTTSFDSIHWRRGISIIKGCRCSNNSNINIIIDNDNDDNNINITSSHTNAAAATASSSLHKPASFHPPSLPHLLCNSQKSEDNREAKSVSNGTQQNGAYHSIGFPTQPGGKTIVAVDVDEVLGSFLSALNRFIADRYSLNHSVSEYHVYEFFKIWNCSRDEADIRVHEFFKTSYFKTGIRPIPGARQALQKLSRFCNLSVVTSRQNAIKDHTIEWIERHYPGLFQEIHFGNHFALDGQSRPKSDICRSLGADVLIDDNPIYAMECAEVGIRVLLFDYENSYPWCKTASVTQHPLVTKVHNWGEVEHRLVSRTFS